MYFKIHKEGWVYFIVSCIGTVISIYLSPILSIFLFILSIYIFYFFRDPIRTIPTEDVIVSPADGIITFIGDSDAPNEINVNQKLKKISIFLSIFDVHVNRAPVTGQIKDIHYIDGKFLNASFDKSSDQNERNIITFENNKKEIFIVSQIAGLIARRIVCNIESKQQINKGERIGIIKFGSRVDLYVPLNYKFLVSLGQRVVGGETIISNPNKIFEIKTTMKI